jgi:hypothetical protein
VATPCKAYRPLPLKYGYLSNIVKDKVILLNANMASVSWNPLSSSPIYLTQFLITIAFQRERSNYVRLWHKHCRLTELLHLRRSLINRECTSDTLELHFLCVTEARNLCFLWSHLWLRVLRHVWLVLPQLFFLVGEGQKALCPECIGEPSASGLVAIDFPGIYHGSG